MADFNPGGWQHYDFPAAIVQRVIARETRPILLLQLGYTGQLEYLSCSSAVTYDSQLYPQGDVFIESLSLYERADFSMPASPDRAAAQIAQRWRGQPCCVLLIPALPGSEDNFNISDSIVLLDGVIDDSALGSDEISFSVISKYLVGAMVPSLRFNDFCSFLPAVGDSLDWGTQRVNVESAQQLVVGSQSWGF